MNLKQIILLFAIILFVPVARAQDCTLFYPESIGTLREMTNYDKKDRVTGRVHQTISDKSTSGGNISMDVETVIYDDKDEEINRSKVEVGCETGVFKVDMSDYVGEMLDAYREMEVEMKGDNLQFPPGMSEGDELPEGNINIQVSSSGIKMVDMDITIKNRKVEGKEEISTSAGSFDCFKISYDMEAKTNMFTVNTSGVEWIAEGVGVVKTESYNKRGKLNSYSLLTRFEK